LFHQQKCNQLKNQNQENHQVQQAPPKQALLLVVHNQVLEQEVPQTRTQRRVSKRNFLSAKKLMIIETSQKM